MVEFIISERIEAAHKMASMRLIKYLENSNQTDPNRQHARELYCGYLRDAAFRNSDGEKEYINGLVEMLTTAVIQEYRSPHLDSYVENAIMEHNRSEMNKRIIEQSAIAILNSKFGKSKVSRFAVKGESDTEVSITWRKRYADARIQMDLETLMKKVEEADVIKNLFQKY